MSSPYPEQDAYMRDFGRFVDHAFRTPDGQPDFGKHFWAAQAIRNDKFSIFADYQGHLFALLAEIETDMPDTMRETLRKSILGGNRRLELAVASKNSETIAEGQAISSLQNRMAKQSIEHMYTSPEEAQLSFVDKLRGDKRRAA